ncbi:MAG: RHS repeat-associated core domain-containing protein [Candidatus Kapaibacterium sp.]|nr:MAG: RHS repeat-associated core domain-containing protein [Candidatus Kapabacteria bacterium]
MVARHHIFAPFLITYDPDGAMVYRKRDGVEGGLAFQRIEEYAWNAFNLLEQFTVRTDAVAEGGGPGCEPDATTMPADVWRYRFNPMQEREQKRQEITSGNVVRDGLAWTYSLLGADTKQLATYNGIEGAFCGQPSVWLWPVEYNSYGPANTRVILRPNGTKEYVIADHLGSPRITVNDQGAILQHTTYTPFGSVLSSTGSGQRTGYIGREADNETGLGNYGVRLYEPEYGRFMSVDVLWGEYEGWQPYQYALSDPCSSKDPSGLIVEFENPEFQAEHAAIYSATNTDGNFVNVDYRRRFDKLNLSDITYRVRNVSVSNSAQLNIERVGTLSSDGQVVFIDIDGSKDATYSREGTHELVHAEQFEDGYVGFKRDEGSSRWELFGNSVDLENEAYQKQHIPNPDYTGWDWVFSRYGPDNETHREGIPNHSTRLTSREIARRTVFKTSTRFNIYYPSTE